MTREESEQRRADPRAYRPYLRERRVQLEAARVLTRRAGIERVAEREQCAEGGVHGFALAKCDQAALQELLPLLQVTHLRVEAHLHHPAAKSGLEARDRDQLGEVAFR